MLKDEWPCQSPASGHLAILTSRVSLPIAQFRSQMQKTGYHLSQLHSMALAAPRKRDFESGFWASQVQVPRPKGRCIRTAKLVLHTDHCKQTTAMVLIRVKTAYSLSPVFQHDSVDDAIFLHLPESFRETQQNAEMAELLLASGGRGVRLLHHLAESLQLCGLHIPSLMLRAI